MGHAQCLLRAGLGQRAGWGSETGEGVVRQGKGKREKGKMRLGDWRAPVRIWSALLFSFPFSLFPVFALSAQSPLRDPGQKFGNRSNIKLASHVQLAEYGAVTDLKIEQELSRPYAYVARRFDQPGFAIISLKDPQRAHVIYNWHIENPEIHQGRAGMDAQYFKTKGRYYYVQAMQFGQSGPDWDLGAVITDVTSLTDTSG